MSWQTELVELTRILLADFDGSLYSDGNMQRLVVAAAMFVSQAADFSQNFTADLQALDITPDPSDSDTRDVSFMNLVALKAACIVNRGDAWKNAGRGKLIRDIANVTIDNRDAVRNKIDLLLKGGWCPIYDEELEAYLRDSAAIAGVAIMSPFRTLIGHLHPTYQLGG